MNATHVSIQIVEPDALTIQRIQFDLCEELHSSFECNAPEYPVETGEPVGDHIVLRPVEYRLRLVVSNTPLEEGMWPLCASDQRCATVMKLLTDARRTRKEIVLTSDMDNAAGLYITGLDFTRSWHSAGSLPIALTLRHVRRTSALTILVPKVKKPLKHKISRKPQAYGVWRPTTGVFEGMVDGEKRIWSGPVQNGVMTIVPEEQFRGFPRPAPADAMSGGLLRRTLVDEWEIPHAARPLPSSVGLPGDGHDRISVPLTNRSFF